MTLRVFVYGTLRRGQRYHRLLEGARFLGMHRTADRYTMVHLGAYPGVIGGGRQAIVGEVYQIDPAMLARLDRLEDCPREYRRQLIVTPYGYAWIYLFRGRPGSRPQIPSGDWLARPQPGSSRPLSRRYQS